MRAKSELLQLLSDCVFGMEDEENVIRLAQEYIDDGYPALQGITDGLLEGMNRAGRMFEAEEYFVSDLLLCADTMYAGLKILRAHLPKDAEPENKIKVVIGVVEGDTHDIGKNLVRILFETAGFEMYDLGRDVAAERFVSKVKEVGASLVCLSTLMTTTMPSMGKVIDSLKAEKIRDQVIVMVGGGPLSAAYAEKIGADAYSHNAVEAVKVAKQLLAIRGWGVTGKS